MNARALGRRHDSSNQLVTFALVVDHFLNLWLANPSVSYVVHDCVIEQDAILGNNGDV